MSDVPEEICREILLRLPVRPLLRCRCVSKSWKCLIDSDQFIKHHLDHTKKKTNNTNLTIVVNGHYSLYAADFDLLIHTDRATFKRLRHPFFHQLNPHFLDPVILGSCDGLLALNKYDGDGDTIVWNPSIQRFTRKDTDAPGITLLAAYDLGTEEVRLVPLPEIAGNCVNVLASLGGCLCLVYRDRNDSRHEVWVMKEYGAAESWSILFTVPSFDVHYMRPLAYSRCGRKVFLVMNYSKLVWYDLDTKSTYSPMVEAPVIYCSYMSTCFRSLVLLNSGTCDSDIYTKKKQRKGNKTSSTPIKDCPTNSRT